MNPISKYIWTLMILFTANTIVFGQGEIIDDVKNAIKTGSSKELTKFLNNNVDVTIDGNVESYSKTQAEFALRDFFKNNPPSSFTIVHQGSSKGGLPYAIGQYLTNNETYRVWMRIKQTDGRYLIHEISFIKE
ncbi:DUF4783 domain-containing protein [Fulvivirga lutimaris]|uniref:DUF4783 domain-containing protein n=1 Tax=Fulvivirga lutimaris TaxID=1819566 RepID=UPI0012BB8565|nr:DUF4783 domain-containing protein [Fulvivirga lutimaris]MTI38771.1 DUF4783 domain-containing protein [Fulvivirga lutimaris]